MQQAKCKKMYAIEVGNLSAKDAKDAKELIFMLLLSHCDNHVSERGGSNEFIEQGYWVCN